MNGCIGLLILFAIVAVPCAIYWYVASAIAAREAAADLELQKNHPEVWRHKHLLAMQKEQMENNKKLAEQRLEAEKEQAKQENLRRNVGLGVTIARIFFGG